MAVQVAGFVGLFYCIFAWIAQFLDFGLTPSYVPAFGGSYGSVLAIVVFNYGFIMTIPSWLNEKMPSVGVKKPVWISLGVSVVVFLLLGFLGGMSMKYPHGQDLLAAIDSSSTAKVRRPGRCGRRVSIERC
jgi:hypothetical protein